MDDDLRQLLTSFIPKLGRAEAVILHLLSSRAEMFGLEMVAASEGQLKRGTVYVTLNRMEDKGYVASRQEGRQPGAIGLPRRLYQITGLGARVLREWPRLGTSLIPSTESS